MGLRNRVTSRVTIQAAAVLITLLAKSHDSPNRLLGPLLPADGSNLGRTCAIFRVSCCRVRV